MKGYVEISTTEVCQLCDEGLKFIEGYRARTLKKVINRDYYYLFNRFFKRKFKSQEDKIAWLKSNGAELFSHSSYYNYAELQYSSTEQELKKLIETCIQKENDASEPNVILLTLNAIEQLRNIAYDQENFNFPFLAYY